MLSQLHYLPLTFPSFSILVATFAFLLLLIHVGILRYAFMHIGLSAGVAMLVLLASLIGAYFNIPVSELPAQRVISGAVVPYFGMRYVIPVVSHWPGTVIAVNVGGALIPSITSLFLLIRRELWLRGAVAVALVAAITHQIAHPMPGLGIALPLLVPVLSTAMVALLLSPRNAGPLAYIGGSVGTLIGADLLNLGRLQGLGAPVESIGGAGTFDGVFLTGILAVLIAGIIGAITVPSRQHESIGSAP
jgi:uncharacterized membrane protein